MRTLVTLQFLIRVRLVTSTRSDTILLRVTIVRYLRTPVGTRRRTTCRSIIELTRESSKLRIVPFRTCRNRTMIRRPSIRWYSRIRFVLLFRWRRRRPRRRVRLLLLRVRDLVSGLKRVGTVHRSRSRKESEIELFSTLLLTLLIIRLRTLAWWKLMSRRGPFGRHVVILIRFVS